MDKFAECEQFAINNNWEFINMQDEISFVRKIYTASGIVRRTVASVRTTNNIENDLTKLLHKANNRIQRKK